MRIEKIYKARESLCITTKKAKKKKKKKKKKKNYIVTLNSYNIIRTSMKKMLETITFFGKLLNQCFQTNLPVTKNNLS